MSKDLRPDLMWPTADPPPTFANVILIGGPHHKTCVKLLVKDIKGNVLAIGGEKYILDEDLCCAMWEDP